MKKCPYCGKENAEDRVVCKRCFAELPVKAETEPKKKAPKKTNKE